jgi:hypothetical protein
MFLRKDHEKSKGSLIQRDGEPSADASLDQLGEKLVRAAQMSAPEVAETVAAPFLYTRIRARIAAEQKRIADRERSVWWAVLRTAERPLMGMALMAAVAVSLFWFAAMAGSAGTDFSLSSDFLATGGGSSFERIVFTDQGAPSNDEVLTTLVNQNESDVQR